MNTVDVAPAHVRKPPRVSVVVLTFDRRELLAHALDAVLAQTVDEIEVLVTDNESSDGTQEFVLDLAARDPRVRYLRNANGGNLSVNRNHAIARAKGEWVAFCDDDDLWLPDKLERQLTAASDHPEAAVVATDAIYFSVDPESGEETEYGTLVDRSGDGWVTFEDLVTEQRTQVVLSSVMIRRDALDAVGPWDTDPGIFAIEDLQYWIRVTVSGQRIRYIDEPLVRFRFHSASFSAPDSRVTAARMLHMVDSLKEQGILSGDDYLLARRGFERRARMAARKEQLKRIPGLKALVYLSRTAAHGRKRG